MITNVFGIEILDNLVPIYLLKRVLIMTNIELCFVQVVTYQTIQKLHPIMPRVMPHNFYLKIKKKNTVRSL